LTLKSLLSQKVKPDEILLWIASENYDKLPGNVLDLQDYGVTIRTCENLRSFNKVIHLLSERTDCFTVIADDDVYYGRKWLHGLVNNCEPLEKMVTCGRGHFIERESDGSLKRYVDWSKAPANEASQFVFPTGVGGVLYPPGIFHKDVTRIQLMRRYCPDSDDIWLYFMAALNGAIFKRVGNTDHPPIWAGSQRVSLASGNVAKGGNDLQIAAMIRAYGNPASREWPTFQNAQIPNSQTSPKPHA
jgi:hypothetical protein